MIIIIYIYEREGSRGRDISKKEKKKKELITEAGYSFLPVFVTGGMINSALLRGVPAFLCPPVRD